MGLCAHGTRLNRRDIAMARTPQDVSASNDTASAFNLGKSTEGNNAFNSVCIKLVEAGEETKRGPLTMLWAIEDAGIDLHRVAKPGTKTGDATNRPVENYTKQVKDAATGESKNVKGNWFTDFTAGTKEGQEWQARIDDVKIAANPETSAKSKWYKEYRNDPIYLANEKNKYTQRLSALRNLIRNAVRIWDKQNELDEYAAAQWKIAEYDVMEGDKVVTKQQNTPKPFIVSDTKNPQRFKALAVGQFLKLDTKEAIEKGSTFDALIDTLTQGDTSTSTEGEKAPPIADPVQVQRVADSLNNYLDFESDKGRVHQAALLTEMEKKSNDAMVLSIGRLYLTLDTIYPKIQGRYERLAAALADAQGASDKVGKVA